MITRETAEAYVSRKIAWTDSEIINSELEPDGHNAWQVFITYYEAGEWHDAVWLVWGNKDGSLTGEYC